MGRLVIGDELGGVLQQVWRPADAVLGVQAGVRQVTDGSVEPAPVASITTVACPSNSLVTITR